MRAHPSGDLRVAGTGRDELPQLARIQARRSEEPAIHRAVIMIGAALSDQFRPALVYRPRGHSGEMLPQRRPRAARSSLIQVRRKGAEIRGIHKEPAEALPEVAECQNSRAEQAACVVAFSTSPATAASWRRTTLPIGSLLGRIWFD